MQEKHIKQTKTTNALRKVAMSVKKKTINVSKIKRLKADGSVGIDKVAETVYTPISIANQTISEIFNDNK